MNSPTKNIVTSLRAIRDERGITIPELAQQTGISETTLRRVFIDDIDNIGGFSYEGTLAPLISLLLPKGDTTDSALSQARIDGLLAVIELKDQMIANIKAQIEEHKEQQEKRCAKCEKDMSNLQHQIDLKDARMDKKDEWIDRLLQQQADLLAKLADKML